MRALLTCQIFACSGPAHAISWEKQGDWMAELAADLVYMDAVPQALTLKQPPVRCLADTAMNPPPSL